MYIQHTDTVITGVNSSLEKFTRWHSTSREQLCVETCVNDTNWEIAVCKTFASVLSQCQRKFSAHILCLLLPGIVDTSGNIYYDSGTPGNLSILQNATDPTSVTLNWSQPLYDYSISCCSTLYNETNCISKHHCSENSVQTAIMTGLKPYTFYECCVWAVHGDTEERSRPLCQCIRTAEAGS